MLRIINNGGVTENTITISLEEYKELLMIKGKYEELKRQIPPHIEIIPSITKIGETMPKYEYELTCEGGN